MAASSSSATSINPYSSLPVPRSRVSSRTAQPTLEELVENIDRASDAKEIYEVVNGLFDRELRGNPGSLVRILSSEDPKGKRVKNIIELKLSGMPKPTGEETIHRINILLRYLRKEDPIPQSRSPSAPIKASGIQKPPFMPPWPKPAKKSQELDPDKLLLKILPPSLDEVENETKTSTRSDSKTALSCWIEDGQKPDLTEEEYKQLKTITSSRKFKQDPSEFFNSETFFGEFYRLTQSIRSDGSIVCTHKRETDFIMAPLSHLLHLAVEANKPWIAKFLIDSGANLNGVDANYQSIALKTIDLITSPSRNQKNKEELLSIFSHLLKSRKPIQEVELFNVLYFCCHHYRQEPTTENIIFNLSLFDEAVSTLLGCKKTIVDYFDTATKELWLKYFAHINHIQGSARTGAGPETTLTGFDNTQYMQLHLRLFLQIVVEDILLNRTFTTAQFSRIYEEFLSTLETTWISQIMSAWKNSKLRREEHYNSMFCESLSDYVYNRLSHLPIGKEYTLHMGWPGHAICVVFSRKKDYLNIRIDNLGQGVRSKHPSKKIAGVSSGQSKLIAKLRFTKTNPLPESDLKNYLKSIFNIQLNATKRPGDDTAKYEEYKKTYYDPGEPLTCTPGDQSAENYPWVPLQTVGNCVYASFSVGSRLRLGNELFNLLSSSASGLLTKINDFRKQNPPNFNQQLSTLQTIQSDTKADFTFELKALLTENYDHFVSQTAYPYIMKPTINNSRFFGLIDFVFRIFNPTDLETKKEETRIKINGPAGIGKTVLSQQLSKEWHAEPRFRESVIHLSLRHLSNEQKYPPTQNYTIVDIIELELFSPIKGRPLNDLERRMLAYELERGDFVWVLDGLDELRILPQLAESINTIVNMPKIIMTSRPSVINPAIQVSFICELDLLEYHVMEIQKFIATFFSNESTLINSDDPLHPQNKIKAALITNPEFKALCSLPVTLDIACKLVQQGNDEIFTLKNLAEIYHCFILAMLQNTYKRQTGLLETVTHSQITGMYKQAIKFTQFLAFTSLKNDRRLTLGTKEINDCLVHRGISLDPENLNHRRLFDDLNAIGLINISHLGAEFIHATFQEYFAALYLIKSLKKSKKSSAHLNALQFITKYKFDLNYMSLFSLVTHQLISNATKARNAEKKENSIKLLTRYLINFITTEDDEPSSDSFTILPWETSSPVAASHLPKRVGPSVSDGILTRTPSSSFSQATSRPLKPWKGPPINIYPQGINLLEIYSRSIQTGLLNEEIFIKQYRNFVEKSFQELLSYFFKATSSKPKTKNIDSYIPFPNSSPWVLETFAKIFTIVPSLREDLNITNRLIEYIEEHLRPGAFTGITSLVSSSSSPAQASSSSIAHRSPSSLEKPKPTPDAVWNALSFIQSIGELTPSNLNKFSQIAISSEKEDFTKGILEISMNSVENILSDKLPPPENKDDAIMLLTVSIVNCLNFLYKIQIENISRKEDEISILENKLLAEKEFIPNKHTDHKLIDSIENKIELIKSRKCTIEINIVKKLVHFFTILINRKDEFQYVELYQHTLDQIRQYVPIMFFSGGHAFCWKKLCSMPSEITLTSTLNEGKLYEIYETAELSQKADFVEEILELTIGDIKNLLKNEEYEAISLMTESTLKYLSCFYETQLKEMDKKGNEFKIIIIEKMIDLFLLLSNYKNNSKDIQNSHEQLLIQLRQYVAIMFSSDSQFGDIICCYKKLLSIQTESNFNLRNILDDTELGSVLRKSVNKLVRRIQKTLEYAKRSDDAGAIGGGYSRATFFEYLGLALRNLLEPIDMVGGLPTQNMTKIIEELRRIAHTGEGRCTSRNARATCRIQAWSALIQYKPYRNPPKDSSVTLNRILKIFNPVHPGDDNYDWPHNQKTLDWLRSLNSRIPKNQAVIASLITKIES